MTLEVRGGGVIPLPYLIEKQRYNLTDEIVQRLRHYKDFKELKKEIEKEDANNDLVIEILSQGVSMINENGTKVRKEKIRGKEPGTRPRMSSSRANTPWAMTTLMMPNLLSHAVHRQRRRPNHHQSRHAGKTRCLFSQEPQHQRSESRHR